VSWLDALGKSRPGVLATDRSSARRDQSARRLPSLVPVTIGPAITHAAPIEVLLDGASVRVAAGCDEVTLRMVLSALERAS